MRVELDYEVELPQPQTTARLWLPLPLDAAHQELLAVEHRGNCRRAGVFRQAAAGGRALYLEWSDEAAPRLHAVVTARVRERNFLPPRAAEPAPPPEAVCAFLLPSPMVPTDGAVRQLAEEIIRGKNGAWEKAQAAYDWVVDHTRRDNAVKACGLGDVRTMLADGKLSGKCVDIGSLFVALARAAGVPAREVFGMRVAPSRLAPSLGKSGDVSTAQHCKTEFYAPGCGWVPADPADVRKAMLEENLTLQEERTRKLREALFGHADPDWLGFNHAREVNLTPLQDGPALNYFMYPYGEVDGVPRDAWDPERFRYRITARPL